MIYHFITELKNRTLLIVLAWTSVVAVGYFYKEVLLFLLVKPNLCLFQHNSQYFIFTNLTDIFSTYLKLISFVGNQFFLAFLVYHLFVFLVPGLYFSEYKKYATFFRTSLTLWFFSIFILNIYLLPLSWKFFLSFQTFSDHSVLTFHLEAKIIEYLDLYINLYYICCLNFQLLVLLIVFVNYIKENLDLIKTLRKFFYLGFFLIATFMTPPDIFSQLIVGMITIMIFELTIVIIILRIHVSKIF
jgi:sec-independent protein translocase protein TatC